MKSPEELIEEVLQRTELDDPGEMTPAERDFIRAYMKSQTAFREIAQNIISRLKQGVIHLHVALNNAAHCHDICLVCKADAEAALKVGSVP